MMKWLIGKKVDAAHKELEEVKKNYTEVLDERNLIRVELRRVKEELEDVKLKKKIEEEDIKHLVKLKLESQEIELKKKQHELERVKDSEVSQIKQEYTDKMNARLEGEVKTMRQMYSEILARIPDMSVRLKGEV